MKVESYDGSSLKGIGSEIYGDVCKTWVEVNSDLFAGDLWKWKTITAKFVTWYKALIYSRSAQIFANENFSHQSHFISFSMSFSLRYVRIHFLLPFIHFEVNFPTFFIFNKKFIYSTTKVKKFNFLRTFNSIFIPSIFAL